VANLPFGYLLREVERNPGLDWVGANGRPHHGPVAVFEATKGERWLRFLTESETDLSFCTVMLASARPESDEVLQIMRKTDVYQSSDTLRGRLYHPIGMAYLDSAGRLRRRRLTSEELSRDTMFQSILDELLCSGLEVRKYQEVTTKRSKQLANKLCIVVRGDDFEVMVTAFMGEKIVPLIQ